MSFVVDHVHASAHGGADTLDNYAPTHARCNRIKGDQPSGTVRTNTGVLDQ